MTIIKRLKVVAVLLAIFMLIVALFSFFTNSFRVFDLILHSPLFNFGVLGICWFLAPVVARFVKIE
jgi:hypothetical protein